jgi:hypothetical protein
VAAAGARTYFIRRQVIDHLNVRVLTTDVQLDGTTAYVTTGTVQHCDDIELHIVPYIAVNAIAGVLVGDSIQHIRIVAANAPTTALTSYYWNPRTQATVTPALADLSLAENRPVTQEVLCDITVASGVRTYFIRRWRTNASGIATSSDFLLDGVTAYVTTGTVRYCDDLDYETVTYKVKTAGTGYSVGDVLVFTRIYAADAPKTLLTSFYYNLVTQAVVTPALAELFVVSSDYQVYFPTKCFKAVNAGGGYSVGDYLTRITAINETVPGTPTVIGTTWHNATQNTVLAAAPAGADVTACDALRPAYSQVTTNFLGTELAAATFTIAMPANVREIVFFNATSSDVTLTLFGADGTVKVPAYGTVNLANLHDKEAAFIGGANISGVLVSTLVGGTPPLGSPHRMITNFKAVP